MKNTVNILIIALVLFVSCNQTPKPEPQRAAFLEGASNFRDLGGYAAANNKRTVWRKLFRSQGLAQLTDNDLAVMREIGVKTVIDFRSDSEVQNAPSRLPEGVKIIRLPIETANANAPSIMEQIASGEVDSLQAIAYMEQANRNFATDFAPQYREFFKILLQPDAYPIVFHCAAGKDRTGFAAAMTLTALGADWNTVMDDYLLTNTYLIPSSVTPQLSLQTMPAMRQLSGVRPSYLLAAHDEIIKKYGSLDNYLQQALGIGNIEKKQLRKYLLK